MSDVSPATELPQGTPDAELTPVVLSPSRQPPQPSPPQVGPKGYVLVPRLVPPPPQSINALLTSYLFQASTSPRW